MADSISLLYLPSAEAIIARTQALLAEAEAVREAAREITARAVKLRVETRAMRRRMATTGRESPRDA